MVSEGAAQNGNHSPQDPITPALPRSDGDEATLASPHLPPRPPQDLAGRKLGQYTILEKIGQGGMGLVFKAFDTALERTVALKVLICSALDDPKQAERFMREARSLARLSHPNLLPVYNVGREGDCHYFAMELLEGETLSFALRRRGRMPPEELLRHLGQILSALHYIHLQGILHRDVKSGNIMLCPRRAVLMDFGLAKDESLAGLTTIGAVLGTPDYMPPETAQGLASGPPTDIYSLGVVMYEALAGTLPFSGRSAFAIIRQHMEVPPPPLAEALPEINPELARIVHQCLAKQPAERFPHCPALAAALVKLLPTPELSALAMERPDFSARQSQKRALSSSPPLALPSPPWGEGGVRGAAATTPLLGLAAPSATVPSVGAAIAPGRHEDTAPTLRSAPSVQARGHDPIPGSSGIGIVSPERHERGAKRLSAWAWMAVGFFGVLFLAALAAHHW